MKVFRCSLLQLARNTTRPVHPVHSRYFVVPALAARREHIPPDMDRNNSWIPAPEEDVFKRLDTAEKAVLYTWDRSGFAQQLKYLRRDFTVARSTELTEAALQLGLSSLESPETKRYPAEVRATALNLLNHILNSATANSISPTTVERLYMSLSKATMRDRPPEILEHLRVFEVTAAKHGQPLAKEKLDQIVAKISEFCHYEAPPTGSSAAPLDRVQPHSRPAMGSFALPPTSATGTHSRNRQPRRRASSSSMSSVGSHVSEIDSSHGHHRDLVPIEVRQKALQCLIALAKIEWKALHPYWNLLLGQYRASLVTLMASDPSLEVRVAATQAIKALLQRSVGYLALARDSTMKTSFTSLSQSLASVAIRVNKTVAALLAESRTSMHEIALLQLAETVVSNSPYEQLNADLFTDLLAAIAHKLGSNDLETLDAAVMALKSAVEASSKTTAQRCLTGTTMVTTAEQLFNNIRSEPVMDATLVMKRWQVLSIVLGRLDAFSAAGQGPLEAILTHIKDTIASSASPIQLQQLAVLAAVTGPGTQDVTLDLPVQLLIQQCVRTALEYYSHTKLESIVLASPLAQLIGQNVESLRLGENEKELALDLLFDMVNDRSKAVRSQAYRAVGAFLQSRKAWRNEDLRNRLCRLLITAVKQDKQAQAQAQAAWHLANVYDSVPSSSMEDIRELQSELFTIILPLAQEHSPNRDAEQMRTSSIRILGCILCQIPPSVSDEQRSQGIAVLLDALRRSWPKVQWNSAIGLKRILSSSEKADPVIVDALLQSLGTDKNMKVRGSALSAIEAILHPEEYPQIQSGLKTALSSIDDVKADLPFAEVARAEQVQSSVGLL